MGQSDTLSPIGEQIDTVRLRRNKLTLYRVAKNAKMDYSQFYRIMRGKSRPTRESLLRICRALGCDEQEAAEIFKLTDYRMPTQEELDEEYSAVAVA
jgi:transcriptional regulator with XRE-family HTH domain